MSSLRLEDKIRLEKFWIIGGYLHIKTTSGKIIKRHKSISPKLENATKAQLLNFEILGSGIGIHWPDLDEDLSAVFLIYPERFSMPQKKAS
ncbi:MAG: hypothetical protein A2Z91_07410 [Deltaproteobacteria bacterium GWA2_38_16]|nr:MAG: hypothetical protein A2Z91_07410 [Deltaproteobacteria bacterium GWA2_38_16]OGQ02734.1 MAG: hypothetical protein A3D19_00745 [Deltaproteobacteria bacterium RIFCSPHIGHO2_02_FULL_38_15]OGQ31868.1 MAG: hypothetical protein A3A72_02325 [Deltaproteobacteria bacterium RIFCSPLOWO2_01_FULL_38_9]OGQ59082.1 MAG: hypothetical protein A3G92_06160 [Deltaproteobacteria bacterium RIFCSPLOWO2_12_FULL_38_8]HBQ20594.1 hypothetical protein [Deltaproteobacteria bacterium]